MKKLTTKLTLVVIMVLVFTLSLVMMVACDINTPDTHNHSYSEDWKSDKDNHWKECSCGDKSELGAHASTDGDEICDTCGYNMHVHSYSDTWKSDETNHWKECSGASCTEKNDVAAHIDEKDANGNAGHDEKCDICGYDMHVHSYGEWKSDETNHWKECSGASCTEKSDIAAHIDEKDGNGNAGHDEKCDICGYNMHVHKYDIYGKDENGHWLVCSCGLKKADSDGAHADNDDDELCDACGYSLHVHSYTEWGWNETEHWKYCLKDNQADASSYEDHTDWESAGTCDTCGAHFKCIDANSDGLCDICKKHVAHVDHDGNFICDIEGCGETLESHEHTMKFQLLTDDSGYENAPTLGKDVEAAFVCIEDGDADHNYCKMDVITIKYCPLGSEVTLSVEDGEYVYYYLAPDYINISSLPSQVVITIGSTTKLERVYYTAYDSEWNQVVDSTVTAISAGTQALGTNNARSILYKASATDGKISFKIDYIPGASKGTAIELEKNKLYTGKDEMWLKYTATKDEELVFYNQELSCTYDEDWEMLLEEYAGCAIYAGLDDSDGVSCYFKYTIVNVKKDTVYYIYIPEIYEMDGNERAYNIKLMDKVEGESYLGYSMSSPAPIEGNTVTAINANGTRYYSWTASADGELKVELTSTNAEAYKNFDCLYKYVDQWGESWAYTENDKIKKGETWLIAVEYYVDGNEGSYTLTLTFTADTTGGGEDPVVPGGDGGEGDEGNTFAFPSDLIGTWYIEEYPGEGTKITITESSLVKGNDMNSQTAANYAIDNSNGTKYTFTIGHGSFSIYESEGKWYYSDPSEDEPFEMLTSEPIFPTSLRGTWYTSLGKEYVITANTLTTGEQSGYRFNVSTDDNDVTIYTFKIGQQSHSIKANGSDWELDGEKLLVTKPVFGDKIASSFVGTWMDENEEVLFTITEDSIYNDPDSDIPVTIADGDILVVSDTKVIVLDWSGEIVGTLEYDTESGTIRYYGEDFMGAFDYTLNAVTLDEEE